MIEIRFHGRGGQGTVVASELLAVAFFSEGRYVQAFPAFGVERRGAPVEAFLRVDSAPIRLRCQIDQPDHLIVLDPTLIRAVDVTTGLKPEGWILVNSGRRPEEFEEFSSCGWRVATIDAGALAVKHRLGTRANPIVNTAILGGFSRATDLVGLEAVVGAIRQGVPSGIEANVAAATEAFEAVKILPAPVGG